MFHRFIGKLKQKTIFSSRPIFNNNKKFYVYNRGPSLSVNVYLNSGDKTFVSQVREQHKVCKQLYNNVCFFDRSIKVVVIYYWRCCIAIYTLQLNEYLLQCRNNIGIGFRSKGKELNSTHKAGVQQLPFSIRNVVGEVHIVTSVCNIDLGYRCRNQQVGIIFIREDFNKKKE